MKSLILHGAIFLSLCSSSKLPAQAVAEADALQILGALPALPNDLNAAYQLTYVNGVKRDTPEAAYQSVIETLQRIQLECQQLSIRFYTQNPTGLPAVSQQPANRVSAQDKALIENATAELAQKMLTDKAFAQQFAKMSEAEQQAYLAKMLSDKGLKPANGQTNTPNKPVAGTEYAWMDLCQAFMEPSFAMHRWDKQMALQLRFDGQHAEVNAWIEAEIKKLPLISLGEYGHDHDPEQVKRIQKQGLEKHRRLADAMMKEAAEMFRGFRQEAGLRMTPLNDTLKKVGFGKCYDFGLNYTLVLQSQNMMFADLYAILDNELKCMEAIAKWEAEWRMTP